MTFKGKAAARESNNQRSKRARFAPRPFEARETASSPPAGRFMPRSFGGEESSAPGTKAEAFRPKSYGGLDIGSIDLFPVQPKLRVGAPDDPFEREADRVAERVMSMPEPGRNTVQRLEEAEEEEVWTKPLAGSITPLQRHTDGFDAGLNLEGRLASRRGRGQPLPEDVRSHMEPRFGADFGGVRLHADGEAAEMARDLNARAFTHGEDIYLGKGHVAGSGEGQRLLAHELAHVVQQSGGASIRSKSKTNDIKLTGARDSVVQRINDEGEVLNSPNVTNAPTNNEKADAAFDKYISLLRNANFGYRTHTPGGTDVLNGGTEGACGTLAYGFVRLLKHGHIDDNATTQPINLKFMTVPLNEMNFIDPNSVGNVRTDNDGYVDVNRFFFSGGHFITNSPDLGRRFDPTTGLRDNAIDGAIAETFREEARGSWVSNSSKIEILESENPGTGGAGYLWKKRSLLSRLFSKF